MSTPSTRRSMRLRAKENERLERERAQKARRCSNGGRVRNQRLFLRASDDEAEHLDGSVRQTSTAAVSQAHSEDSSEANDQDMVVETPSRRRTNNFIKVYNSYNQDVGIDGYEGDFIDDRQMVHESQERKRKKQTRQRQRSQVGGSDSDDECSSEEAPTPLRRALRGPCRRPRVRESSEGESEDSLCGSGVRRHRQRPGRVGRVGRCSDTEEEEEEAVQPTRGNRRKRSLEQCSTDDDSATDQESPPPPAVTHSRKKRLKQLESDDEISLQLATPSRPRSSRAQKLKQNKERKTNKWLRKLQSERAKQKGEDHSDTGSSCSSSEGDGCRGDGDGGESVETPTVDPAKLLEKILFGDSGSSEEDSDWIVSDFEDFMPNSDSRLPMEEDVGELDSNWKDKMSVKNIFKGCHDSEWWLNNPNEKPTVDTDELSSLICAAGRADIETLKSLLPHTDFHSLTATLETKGTTLLHILIEAPLVDMSMTAAEPDTTSEITSSSTVQNTDNEHSTAAAGHGVADDTIAPPLPRVLDKDSASLSCLQALSDLNNKRLQYSPIVNSLLEASSKRHPSVLAAAVWHGRSKCVSFLLNAGASPFDCGLVETNVRYDILESSSPCSSHASSSPPPSLLHLVLLGREGDGDGEKGKSVQLLEQLLPLLDTELELTDTQVESIPELSMDHPPCCMLQLGLPGRPVYRYEKLDESAWVRGKSYTPLMHAADIGDSAALSLLLSHGASINCKDPKGTTPLHLAALSGWVKCVEVLITYGHPVDCRDEKGWPPLLYAHFASHQECVLALMKEKPGQLSVISELLKRTPEDGTEGKIRTVKVVRSLLVSLAHHEAYYSLFNSFISQHLSLLDDEGFGFMKHCMALLSFENKQAWFRGKLLRLMEHGRTLTASFSQCSLSLYDIPREDVVDSAYSHLRNSTAAQCWLGPLDVTFKNEPGICTGPRKEFWSCLSRALAGGEERLFMACDDGQLSLQPCTVFAKYCRQLTPSTVNTHMEKLQVMGMLLAQAMFHGDTLDLNLTKPLIKQLMGCPLSHPGDLEAIDKSFYHSLTTWLEGGDIDDLELTFTCTLQSPWDHQSLELPLQEGGRHKPVRKANKEEYVSQMSRFKLEDSLRDELAAFRSGFWKVIPVRCLQVFMPDELSLLLSGVPTIDVEDWQRNTEYCGLNSTDDIIVWFWCLVWSLKEEEKALLLKFCTGSPRVPTGGFAKLQGLSGPTKFRIMLIPGKNKIPQAATCFNTLKLTSYSCEQDLRDKTLIAIRYGCEGFEFS